MRTESELERNIISSDISRAQMQFLNRAASCAPLLRNVADKEELNTYVKIGNIKIRRQVGNIDRAIPGRSASSFLPTGCIQPTLWCYVFACPLTIVTFVMKFEMTIVGNVWCSQTRVKEVCSVIWLRSEVWATLSTRKYIGILRMEWTHSVSASLFHRKKGLTDLYHQSMGHNAGL